MASIVAQCDNLLSKQRDWIGKLCVHGVKSLGERTYWKGTPVWAPHAVMAGVPTSAIFLKELTFLNEPTSLNEPTFLKSERKGRKPSIIVTVLHANFLRTL
jgi:hypothetical protein